MTSQPNHSQTHNKITSANYLTLLVK